MASRKGTHLGELALLISLLWLRNAAAAEEPSQVDSLGTTDATAVVIDGVSLFKVAGTASFPSAKRAEDVSTRILDVAADPRIALDEIKISKREVRTDILAGTRHLVATVEADADLENASIQDVASMRVIRIKEAIDRYRADRQPERLTRSTGTALAYTAAAALVWFLTRRAFRFTFDRFERRYRSRVHAVKLNSYEVVRAESIWHAVNGILRIVRFIVLIAFVYVYLSFTLREFPWTRGVANSLLEMFGAPLRSMGTALVAYVPNLIFLVILAICVRYALKVTNALSTALAGGKISLRGFDADWAHPTYNIVRMLIVLLALVIAYPYLPGSGSAAFQGLSIFAGLMLSLGASSAMASLIAGYTVTYRRAFRVGDRVKIGDLIGVVTQVRLLVTHLKTEKNEEVVVPNSMVLQSHVVNYSKLAKTHGLILHASVGIGYETPWRQVEGILLLAAERTRGILQTPRPFVLERGLGDFAITYEVNVYVDDTTDLVHRYTALHRNIIDAFNEYGVQIMTPAYEGDPEQPKIVPKDQWYTGPASMSVDG